MSTKIKCNTLTQAMDGQTYTTPKGHMYTFYHNIYIPVDDAEDAIHFLKAGNGELFSPKKGKIKEVIKKLKSFLTKKEEEVDEDNPPEETGVLDPNADDLTVADGELAPLDGDNTPLNTDAEAKKLEEEAEDKKMRNKEEFDYYKLSDEGKFEVDKECNTPSDADPKEKEESEGGQYPNTPEEEEKLRESEGSVETKIPEETEEEVKEDSKEEKVSKIPSKKHLMKQSKKYVDELALNTYGIQLDRRETMEKMIKEFEDKLKVQMNE